MEPVTVGTIALLAFNEFIKSSAGEAAKKADRGSTNQSE